jgi:hypothetical protein
LRSLRAAIGTQSAKKSKTSAATSLPSESTLHLLMFA